MKQLLLILGVFALCSLPLSVQANEEEITQEVINKKSYATINLNSQIKENGSIDKQTINNKGSWFNININRNTFKFYCDADNNNK